jgi:hypothetical protein
LEIGLSVLKEIPISCLDDGQDKKDGGAQQKDIIDPSLSPRNIRQSDEEYICYNEKCEVFTHRCVRL